MDQKPVRLKAGDKVKLKVSLQSLGISPASSKELEILAGIMTVEEAEFVPVDDHPGFQSIRIEGLPYMFYTGTVKKI